MALDKTFFTHPATKVSGCMAVVSRSPGVFSMPEPDFVLVRARDLKHILMMWDSSISLRAKGGAWKHTEKTALVQLRNVANSAPSLAEFMADLLTRIQAGEFSK